VRICVFVLNRKAISASSPVSPPIIACYDGHGIYQKPAQIQEVGLRWLIQVSEKQPGSSHQYHSPIKILEGFVMSLREFIRAQKIRAGSGIVIVARGVGASLGMAALLGGSAIAAPLQIAQQTGTPDDVIVDQEGQRPESTGTSGDTSTSDKGPRFTCQTMNGQYTVLYHPESQPGQSYAWANPSAMGGGWTPERRCNEISRRLESYRPDGLLEMRTALENGYNTVCVTTERVSSCRIVLTVPPGQDPTITRDRVFQNLTIADSGQQTQGVTTFTGGGQDNILNQVGQILNIGLPNLGSSSAGMSDSINLRPFLDRADGGTGERLRGGMSNRPGGARLNPNRFR
jgi:hypothetical protein